ncbi:hypothetical protein EBX31_05550 [bacterium]|nr:hypothetical protein [bacterium]
MRYAWMSWLPRRVLDLLETSDWEVPLCHADLMESWVEALRKLKIAFVRQDVFLDLYCADPKLSGPELVRNSVQRTGPAGLLVDLQADYWILKEDSAPECSVWMEKIANDPDPQPDAYRSQKDRPPRTNFSTTFASHSVKADEVPWEDYDLVVSMDISVPFRIISRTRRPLWAYLPGDPGVPTAKRSLREPPGNYNLSLSHGFRRYPVRPSLGPRTIEFPYTFLRQSTWKRVFPPDPGETRLGTMVESHTDRLLGPAERAELSKLGPVRRPAGSIQEVADSLNRSRFYFRCGGGPVIGNGIIEAAAAGCLAMGNPREFVNRSLFTRSTQCDERHVGIRKMQQFNLDQPRMEKLCALQGALVDYFCFFRPARDILGMWTRLKKNKFSF